MSFRNLSPALRQLVVYTGLITIVSVLYFLYVFLTAPPTVEKETFLSEVGEGIGEVAMWAFIFIYFRTALKLIMGKGPISRRLLPEYKAPPQTGVLKRLVVFLDKTHVHVGIAAVAIAAVHIALMGQPFQNLFFVAVILLILWQTGFGFVLRWRKAPADIKKYSFSVHAQLVTGVMLGIFAWFGHILVDQ
ncbi:MAG: hypothetical protein KTR32_37105 [Granulosicoccus sp.]|nr:hypothetical protein [Granulosicoccus sp.]